MRKWFPMAAALVMITIFAMPGVRYTEDKDTVALARTIYAMAHGEDYETKLAIGSMVMNRVEDPWFDATLSGVLNEQMQLPAGQKYDNDSLNAAHAVLSGKRTLKSNALYYNESGIGQPVGASGSYTFYAQTDRF